MRARFAVVALLFVGCAKTSPSDLCRREGQTYCSYLFECCTDLERYRVLGLDETDPVMSFNILDGFGPFILQFEGEPSQGSCEAQFDARCGSDLAYLDAAFADGRVTVNEAATDTCLRPLEDALDACDPNAFFHFDYRRAECQGLVAGTVAENGSCFGAGECAAPGSVCEPMMISISPDAPRTLRLEGLCRPPAKIGEECGTRVCAPELFCDPVSNRCAALGGIGANCNGPFACQTQLFCDFNIVQCVPLPGPGQPCNFNAPLPCGGGLNCLDGLCSRSTSNDNYAYCDGT